MTQSDPTDDALAAIASLLDRPVENLSPKVEAKVEAEAEAAPSEVGTTKTDAPPSASPDMVPIAGPEIDVEHYERFGPGPLDAIRFRWKARRDDFGNYYVDETIGPHSRPLTTGPMPKTEVVGFIDARAREAEQRFNALKTDMTVIAYEPDYPLQDGGES
ncbi:hypothetical protein BH11PSE4_BH11PSE4_11280 [soil metagenome]